ncbi:MAG: hypothetical protein M5R36_05400 [Deltaproteobacteria bacterium]|nr:hypothetical protein [Deltaproteobacteria bacterium]
MWTRATNTSKRGRRHEKEGRLDEALNEYVMSAKSGITLKLIGDIFLRRDQYEDARRFYRYHAEIMPMNRTRPSFNEYLREFSGATRVLLADIARAANGADPELGLAPPDLCGSLPYDVAGL